MENVENPEQYIAAVLKKTKPQHIERTYDVRGFENATEFLEILARKGGRLLKGGEGDVDGVAKMVLNDFLRGKIPWFTPPPVLEGQDEKGIEGRKGMLREMGRVRREQGENPVEGGDVEMSTLAQEAAEDAIVEEDEFEGFDEEGDESMESSDEAGPERGGVGSGPTDMLTESGGVVLDAPG